MYEKQTVDNLLGQIEGYGGYDLDAIVQVFKPVDGKLVSELCHGRVSYCDCSSEDKCLTVEFEPTDGKKLTILENAVLYEELADMKTSFEVIPEIRKCYQKAFSSLNKLGEIALENTKSSDIASIIQDLQKLDIVMSKYRELDKK